MLICLCVALVEAGMKCVRQQLEFGNRCEVLKQFFKCENGCGHQAAWIVLVWTLDPMMH